MLLQPKNTKYKKGHKQAKKTKGIKTNSNELNYGSYGLKTINGGNIHASHIEAVRRVIIRKIRKVGKIWIRLFPYKPITTKPTKTRMGKGKGSVQYWVCPVKRGQIMFEINGNISKEDAKLILYQASQKLPVSTKFVSYKI